MHNQMATTTTTRCRPVVYIAVHDRARRAAIVDALHRQGWAVIEYPTCFHLLEATADLIEGRRPAVLPGLLVVDAVSRGCSGTTLAAGLRELDVRIPVVVVARPGDPVIDFDDPHVRVVASRDAPSAIAEIARPLSPAHALDRSSPPERALA